MTERTAADELAAYASIKRAFVTVRFTAARQLQKIAGVTPVQFDILYLLDSHPGGKRMHEVADLVGVTRSGLTYQISKMEDLGWVRRIPDSEDARSIWVALTPAGEERVRMIQDAHVKLLNERVFSRLDDDEFASLVRIMGKLAGGPA